MATHKKKAKLIQAFKSVSEFEVNQAMQKGTALRRVWQLQVRRDRHICTHCTCRGSIGANTRATQNITTKAYADLVSMQPADIVIEVNEHIKRHGTASLSWLHLLISKVDTKEEADDLVPKMLVLYQGK